MMILNNLLTVPVARGNRLPAFSFLLCMLAFVPAANAGDLLVVVDNIKNDRGVVRVALSNAAQRFPYAPVFKQFAPARKGSVSLVFKHLPSGKYAVAAFHDLNANEKLDTNFVGKPVEPYGFSREARGSFGPPSYDDAAIDIAESAKTISVVVQ